MGCDEAPHPDFEGGIRPFQSLYSIPFGDTIPAPADGLGGFVRNQFRCTGGHAASISRLIVKAERRANVE